MLQTILTVAADGELTLPGDMCAQLGVQAGDKMVARCVDGALILEPIVTAIRRAQLMVRNYVPEGVRLSEELIAERRVASQYE